jgi:hypothetical protein
VVVEGGEGVPVTVGAEADLDACGGVGDVVSGDGQAGQCGAQGGDGLHGGGHGAGVGGQGLVGGVDRGGPP